MVADESSVAPSAEGLTEAQLQDLARMAEQEGITLDEAIGEFAWHEPFSQMVSDLRERFPESFAGARIEGEGAWIAFRGTAPDGVAEKVHSFPKAVEIRTERGFSESELDQWLQEVHYSVWERRDLVAMAASGYDIATGGIQVEVESQAAAGLSRAALHAELRKGLPPSAVDAPVDIKVVDAVRGGQDTVYGGGALSSCTAGFTVYNSNGRGLSTAAHCDNSQTYAGRLRLSYVAGHGGRWGDVQWHTSSEFESDDFYYTSSSRRDTSARGYATEGQRLCRYGRTTGTKCDTVYQLNHCRGDYCRLTAMHNRYADLGDSGGPWYYGNTAYGIHSGYKWWNFKSRDLFTPVTYLNEALGVIVATS